MRENPRDLSHPNGSLVKYECLLIKSNLNEFNTAKSLHQITQISVADVVRQIAKENCSRSLKLTRVSD